MKYLKVFEAFGNAFKTGDMVYVDVYGPYTLSYHDNNDYMVRSIPFRPVVVSGNFNANTQYEIIFLKNGVATLYDEDNNICDINLKNLTFNIIDEKYIKDCFDSSFDDFDFSPFRDNDKITYINYTTSYDIIVKMSIRSKENFQHIYENEFKPRLLEDGLKVNMWVNNDLLLSYRAKITVMLS